VAHSPEVVSKLLFERAPWDALDAEFEKRIPFDSPSDWRDVLSRMCQSGEAFSYRLVENGKRVGVLICKVDEGAARELVVVAAYCAGSQPFAREIGQAAELIAREQRCISIRFHTVRPAAARLAAEEFGYRLTEVIMRKNVVL
jgi:hypothetical protein